MVPSSIQKVSSVAVLFMLFNSSMTGDNNGAGTAYPSRTPEFIPGFANNSDFNKKKVNYGPL